MTRDGTLETTGSLHTLRFERDLNASVEKVWSALTEPERFKDWLSADGDIELRVGGRVELRDHDIDSTVVAIDPPTLIEFGWNGPRWDNGGTVRWELSPTATGTRLVLIHKMPTMSEEEEARFKRDFPELPDDWAPVPSTLAGWHTILDRLEAAVAGTPKPESMDEWRTHHEHYKSVTRS